MKRITCILLLTMLVVQLKAAEVNKTLKNTNEARRLSERVSDLFYKDSISLAFKEMKVYWPLEDDEIEVLLDKTVKNLNLIDNVYGYRIGPVKISEDTIQDIALKETYFVRYEKSAIKLIFKYYNTGHGWILNGFKWDDEFSTEFK